MGYQVIGDEVGTTIIVVLIVGFVVQLVLSTLFVRSYCKTKRLISEIICVYLAKGNHNDRIL